MRRSRLLHAALAASATIVLLGTTGCHSDHSGALLGAGIGATLGYIAGHEYDSHHGGHDRHGYRGGSYGYATYSHGSYSHHGYGSYSGRRNCGY